MFHSQSRTCARSVLANVFLACTLMVLLVSQNIASGDEQPAFFLKIAKSIPRVGRSGELHPKGYFPLYSKTVPRIGRGDSGDEPPEQSWPTHYDEDPFAGPVKRRMDYPAVTDAWSWQHFPLAIEGPRELWRTLAGYSSDTSDEIDNEIWQRKKRTGDTSPSQEIK